MNVEQPKEKEQLRYVDKLVMLDNGSLLIGRILIDDKYKIPEAIAVYRPMQILRSETDVFMRKWIPPSQDDVFMIPMARILTMTNPNSIFVKSFEEVISGTNSEYTPTPEQQQEMVEADAEAKAAQKPAKKETLH